MTKKKRAIVKVTIARVSKLEGRQEKKFAKSLLVYNFSPQTEAFS